MLSKCVGRLEVAKLVAVLFIGDCPFAAPFVSAVAFSKMGNFRVYMR